MRWLRGFLYIWVAIAIFILSGYLTVNILLKTGGTVICPDVRGKNVDEARKIVQSNGLSLSVVKYERRNDVPFNHITVQKPEANISTRKGRVVLVMVSEGPELVRVPSVTGYEIEDVENLLKEINVKIEKTIYIPNPKVGKVIMQIPKAGEDIIQGKGVTLYVGEKQKIMYVMPDIKPAELPEISKEMNNKDIKYRITYERNETGSRTEPMIKTSIPAKSIFKANDEIEIKLITGGLSE
jgi:serine/threonine-protein kinase